MGCSPSIINYHKYDASLSAWSITKEIKLLSEHIEKSIINQNGRNSLWKYFGISQTGNFKPEESSLGDKVDLIMQRLNAIEDNSSEDNYEKLNKNDTTLQKEIETFEKERIIEKLKDNNGNISATAEMLGMSRPTLYSKINKYRISLTQ